MAVLNTLAVGQDVGFPEGVNHTISIETSTAGAGNDLLVGSADGQSGVGDGGNSFFFAGTGFDFGGEVDIRGGAATNGSGIGGNVLLTPGTGPNPVNDGIVEVVGSSAFLLPSGDDSERPAAPSDGMFRYSTEAGFEGIEYYDGGWFPLGVGGISLPYSDAAADPGAPAQVRLQLYY